MRSTRSTNQNGCTRNRQQPQTPPNQNVRREIVFVVKQTYRNSYRDANGVLILSKRKRGLITDEEKAERKCKKLVIAVGKVSLVALRHEVVNL